MPFSQPQQAQPLAPKGQQQILEVPLRIVGGNKYGRYKKISTEQTFNMIVSDDWLVDYAGYAFILALTNNLKAEGRGIHSSVINNLMIVVVDDGVFSIKSTPIGLIPSFVGHLSTSVGEVYISENNGTPTKGNQIALSDGANIYIYNTSSSPTIQPFVIVPIDFTPGFLSFQNSRFIVASVGTNEWRLSDVDVNGNITFPEDSQHIGLLQTKPDTVQAAVPMPGRGNMLFLFGTTVGEQWNDVGAALFPYQKTTSFNLDYGCINPNSIAYQGTYIVWIGVNEEAGLVVMYTTGGDIKEVSTDGIDYLFSTLKNPQDCSGFLVKVDGHLFYQFTFKSDNISLILDLTTETFFTVTDENLNYHIARKIVYFNNTYYFVSYNDGNLYEFGTKYTNYKYQTGLPREMPRIRYCPTVRLPNQRPFIAKSLGFTIEQGQINPETTIVSEYMITENTDSHMLTENGLNLMITEGFDHPAMLTYNMAVDLSISRDGGETFSSEYRQYMNPTGQRKSRFIYQRLGRANEFTPQLQFIGNQRFVCNDGILEIYI